MFSKPGEAEIVAVDYALRLVGSPALNLWDTFLGKSTQCIFHEGNSAMIQVCRTGRNLTMRHLGRTRRVDVRWLHERFGDPAFVLYKQDTIDETPKWHVNGGSVWTSTQDAHC